MQINSHNEWDELHEVVVGQPGVEPSLIYNEPSPVDDDLLTEARDIAREAFPEWLVEEITEDVEGLVKILEDEGVTVHRPEKNTTDEWYSTPRWSAKGSSKNAQNARDLHLVVGNKLIESPSQERDRYLEATSYYQVWKKYLGEKGCEWIPGPKPLLAEGYKETFPDPEGGRREDGNMLVKLNENEILFEAANTVRMGRDLLYLVSRSGNRFGARWLQSVLGDEYRVHTTEQIYRSSHIDSTVICLRPGLVLLNGERVDEDNCPEIFDDWEKIYFNDIVPIPDEELEFHENIRKPVHDKLEGLGVQSSLGTIASDWIGLNIFSVNPNTVIVDERQEPLIDLLENEYGFDCIPISYRHSYIHGGIHCNTLDTVRESKLEDYFPSVSNPVHEHSEVIYDD